MYALAFATTALSALAFVVHLFVLQLFTHDPHLPACSPDQRVCAETYNLLLVMCALGAPLAASCARLAFSWLDSMRAGQLNSNCFEQYSAEGLIEKFLDLADLGI